MIDNNINSKKRKKGSISEEDTFNILKRYSAITVLTLLREVSRCTGVKLDLNALVKNTSTGISNVKEYQMLWRHFAYRADLVEKSGDGDQPLDDDSDLEYEVEPCPSVSCGTLAEAAACVKVLSGLPNDSSLARSSMVDAPLTINIPTALSYKASSENSHSTCSMPGMNITVPVSVQKKLLPAVTVAEPLERNGPAGANFCNRRGKKPWSEAEDLKLVAAVQKRGVGNWANISRGDFKGDRSGPQLAQRWGVIKKQFGNLNVEGNSAIPQLSEAQLATRSALSLALDMPDNPGLKITSSSVPPTASGEATARAQSQFQKGPFASGKARNQSREGPSTSVSSHSRPRESTIMSIPGQNPSQQGPVASVQVTNQSQQGPMPTKTSPGGSFGSTLKPRVTLKKAPAKPFSTTGSILKATAVAVGARIGSPKAAASLLKAAQSQNAIHIMTTGVSSVKPLIPSGTTSQYVCIGLTAEPHSGSVKPATQKIEHTSSISPSLNASIRQCNPGTSSPAVEGPPKEDRDIKSSLLDSLPKDQVRENRACGSKTKPGVGVENHKENVSNPESELKNLEAVAAHPNKKLTVQVDRVDVIANLVEESEYANDRKTDCSPVKKSVTQPKAEDSCRNPSLIAG